MKRAADQTLLWVVVPIGVFASCLFIWVAQWLSESNGSGHQATQSRLHLADSPISTPPVVKHKAEASLGDSLPHLLPRMERVSAESAKATKPLPTNEGGLRQCLTSSNAVSVLASLGPQGQKVNTGWQSTDATEGISFRPVPLLNLEEKPRPMVAAPLPRYGANVSDGGQRPESTRSADLLFDPPAIDGGCSRDEAEKSQASASQLVRTALETTPEEPHTLPATFDFEETVRPLPPVEPDFDGDVLLPLPPVESVVSEPGDGEIEPPLIPQAQSEPQESAALTMVAGLFRPVVEQSEQEIELPIATDAEARAIGAAVVRDVVLPLPPVENDPTKAEPSEVAGKSWDAKGYERTWDLELMAQEADKHTRRGFELAGKRAYFAARMEFTRALRIVAQALDTQRQTNRHSQALAAGLRALDEAEDFLPREGRLEAELDLAVIAGAHRTPVLSESDLEEMTPLAAIQSYHTFAQEQMAIAGGKETAGSMALYGLGKLYVAIGQQRRGDVVVSARPKAMVLLQASLLVLPTNHMASNELGVLLSRNGRPVEAAAAFEHSVNTHPTAEGYRNLALTYERLGEMDKAYEAAQRTLMLRGRSPSAASNAEKVRWVSPEQLARTRGSLRTASASETAARTR